MDIQTRRPESSDDLAFVNAAHKAAEYLSMTIDARPKQYGDTTFENLRRIFTQIQECGYLDKIYLAVPEPISESNEEELNSAAAGVGGEADDTVTADENSLEEGMEKLSVLDDGPQGQQQTQLQQPLLQQQHQPTQQQLQTLIDSNGDGMLQQQQQQPISEQHLEQLQLQQPQPGNVTMSVVAPLPQVLQVPTLPPTSAATVFPPPGAVLQAAPQPPHSGTTTPVQLYAAAPPSAQQQQQQQGVPPQLQQVINIQQAATAPPPQMVPPQGRPLMTSPAAASQLQQQQPGLVAASPAGTVQPLHAGVPPHFPPTTVRAVEQGYFKQHQYMQQMRPLAEVIGGGSFYFLQDSELDSPDIGCTTGSK